MIDAFRRLRRLPRLSKAGLRARQYRGAVKNPWRLAWDYYRKASPSLCLARLKSGEQVLMRNLQDDEFIFRENFIEKCYEAMIQNLTCLDSIIDIGAHIGCFSISCAGRARRIVAVEPEPDNYEILCQNIELNGYAGIISPIQAAVTSGSGTARLYLDRESPGLNSLLVEGPHRGAGGSIAVDTTSLRDLIRMVDADRIDLLKLDCEGGEYEILYRADPHELRRCRAIIAEVHGFEHLSSEPKGLISHLERLGYRVSFTANGKEFRQGHGLGLMRAVIR